MRDIKIDPGWKTALAGEFTKSYWESLTDSVRKQYQTFDLCPFERVKVVIVGQDPYHGRGQANGLSFSVNDGIPLPPSLQNIYKEIHNDLGVTPFVSGDLTRWAKQGVLMLNSVLTVLAGKPASHAGAGWETFTDAVIQALNTERSHIVYLLWGKYAQTKGSVIDKESNLVLTSGHPSPYSASLFFNKHHFSQCNTYLIAKGLEPIDWH
jgi:uracil-DNA glycosylase